MRIERIKISKLLGIDEMEISPSGAITVISGKNGSGKSSVLEAIKAATKGGTHQAELIRQGAEGAEVVLVMDDDGKPVTLTKKIGEAKSTFDLRDAKGKMGSPGSRLKSFFDQVGINPVDLLTCSDKERVKLLLQAINVEADKEKLEALTGISTSQDDALLAVDEVRKAIYDQRTQQNADAKSHRSNATAFVADSETLPSEAVDTEAIAAEILEIESRADYGVSAIEELWGGKFRDVDRRIAEIKTALSEAELSRAGFEDKRRGAIQEERAKAREAIAPLRERQNTASTINASVGHRNSLIERASAENRMAGDCEAKSKSLTGTLDSLDTYKKELLASLPIEGVSIEDGQIHVGGIPFSTLNNAERVKFAVRVAMLRAGDCPIICLDNCELLDTASFAQLQEEIESSGCQAFVTRVSDDALLVK